MEKVSAGKIGRYEIIRVLGRGGMGEVLLAQDENLGRRVAIKRPFKSAVADGFARFQVEAKAATLRHPNIPAVYEMGVDDDLPFIAMEFVEGENLEKLIESRRDIDLITKLRIIEQVCSALGYAHENGIIHRDIKPANIIVQPDGVAKIIDFGIAKLQDDDPNSGLTKASQLIGSLHYIAPERFYGGKVDGRADIFSVGVTLFKLLTGKEPFTGGEATASFKIMNEAHAGLSAYLHDYPKVLDEIVEKSLAKNPDDRYQTGEDFADALHEVIEDLKRTRVSELFNDAERLTTERRFAPALELLDEAIKLDPSHTQARKLRKFVREHQERIRRAERLRECLLKSDEALLSGNFDEALNQLKDAQNLDPSSEEIKSKIQSVEDKKRRFENSTRAFAEAERVKARGDVTGALRIVTRALEDDPDNKKLLSLNAALQRQMEIEAQREKLLELQENATRALAVRDYDTAEKLLNEAAAIDPANADTDKLRRELSHARELEQRRAVLEEIQVRVQEFIRADAYDQASDLLNRALERLPNETLLHRLKAEVDGEARKYDVRRVVDMTIAQANELFATSPFEALTVVQKALENIPGEERLIGYERSLRQQFEARRSEQLRADTVLKARELMENRQFEKAIGVLESFQVEVGQHPDVDGLLSFAREELARRQRTELVSKALSEARTQIRDGRFEDAAALLEKAHQQTGDAAVGNLLEEIREQQAAVARKLEALMKRVESLRERGELDEAIQLLQEQLTATPGNADVQQLVNSLTAERKQKQVISIAMRAANEAVRQKNFAAALESLHTVVHAYGETAEITTAIKDVERQRSAHADQTVGKSIESAQAALLKKDPQGALDALKLATPVLEHADAQKQAEWQRIGQSVKKALQQSGAATTISAFDQQLSAIAQTRPRKTMLYVLIGAALLVLLVSGFAVWKLALVKPKGSIAIQNVPAGAKVLIDDVAANVDASGNVQVPVKAGKHRIVISKDGFQTKDKSYDVQGQFTLDGTLFPQGIRLGKMLFSLPADVAKVSVTAGGKSYGEVAADQTIDLPVGVYPVTISAPGYQTQNLPGIEITEASASNPVPIKVEMAKIAAGTLAMQFQGGITSARMFVNGRPQPGEVHPNQKVTLPEGTYTLRFESLGYKPAEIAGIKVANQAETPVTVNFEKILGASGTLSASQYSITRGDSVTLTWEAQNASGLQISGLGPVQNSGTKQVSPTATTTYALTANNQQLATTTIQVTEPVKVPKVVSFSVSQNSIETGRSVTLTWQVDNAASVQITDLGVVPPLGSRPMTPAKSTIYQLIVNGSPLSEQTVEVHPPAKLAEPDKPAVTTASAKPVDPTPQLKQALKTYEDAFNAHDIARMKAAWPGMSQDQANAWSSVFKSSKYARVSNNCQWGSATISGDSAVVPCTQSLEVEKGGSKSQKTWQYTFANRNGTWVLNTMR